MAGFEIVVVEAVVVDVVVEVVVVEFVGGVGDSEKTTPVLPCSVRVVTPAPPPPVVVRMNVPTLAATT